VQFLFSSVARVVCDMFLPFTIVLRNLPGEVWENLSDFEAFPPADLRERGRIGGILGGIVTVVTEQAAARYYTLV
jgi:hypothetical protein